MLAIGFPWRVTTTFFAGFHPVENFAEFRFGFEQG